MRHDWVFDVLGDLKSYARANGLPELAAMAEETLKVAMAEIASQVGQPQVSHDSTSQD